MMKRVMIDLNVIIDVLENRPEWVVDSARVCALCAERKIIGFVPVHALTTIYYIVRKRGGKALADRSVDWILTTFRIARCGAPQFQTAQACEIDDFEDAVVAASAAAEKCSAIITRNTGHFTSSPVPAVTPSAFHV